MGTVHLELVHPTKLNEARLQLHYAAQIPAAVGHALIAPRGDDSQSNLGWDDDVSALVGHETPRGYSVGIRLYDMTVIVLSADGHIVSECPLDGKTLDEGIAWITEELTRLVGDRLPAVIQLREYDLPEHAIATGAQFSCESRTSCTEIGHWFAHGDAVLRDVSTQFSGASDARVWPHHFDMGVLFTLDPDADPEEARAVGIGLSPGDGTIPEPYWYAYAYPMPELTDSPHVHGGGVWNTEGFTGPLLRGSVLYDQVTAEAQLGQAKEFAHSAVQLCHELVRLAKD